MQTVDIDIIHILAHISDRLLSVLSYRSLI